MAFDELHAQAAKEANKLRSENVKLRALLREAVEYLIDAHPAGDSEFIQQCRDALAAGVKAYLCIECGANPSAEEHKRPDGSPCLYLAVRLPEAPPAVGVRVDERAAAIEAKAREIYDGWKHLPGWVPWVEGGNSHRQDEARRIAVSGVKEDGRG